MSADCVHSHSFEHAAIEGMPGEDDGLLAYLSFLMRPNALGKTWVAMITNSSANALSEKACRYNQYVAFTRLVLARAAYRATTGGEPSSLQALLPHYLDQLPIDPLTNASFTDAAFSQLTDHAQW